MRAETTTAAPGENAIGCGNVYRGKLVGFLVLGCAPMRNRDICIAVPTYRSVNKCVHYTSVLLPRRTRHVKHTLECTRSLGVESGRVSIIDIFSDGCSCACKLFADDVKMYATLDVNDDGKGLYDKLKSVENGAVSRS